MAVVHEAEERVTDMAQAQLTVALAAEMAVLWVRALESGSRMLGTV